VVWKHRLISKDVSIMRGICEICGPVDVVKKKNGSKYVYVCAISRRYQRHFDVNGKRRIDLRLREDNRTIQKLTQDQWNNLHKQKHCEICGRNLSKSDKCIDHNHQTSKIRGVICRCCNLLLGLAKDDIYILSASIKYLVKYSG